MLLFKALGGVLSYKRLNDLVFLLGHEAKVRDTGPFYAFVPFEGGPHSFCLGHETARLQDLRLLEDDSQGLWRLNGNSHDEIDRVPYEFRQAIANVKTRYGAFSHEKLNATICHDYPRYRVPPARETSATTARPVKTVFTAGYEGQCVDGFLNRLVTRQVRRLIDVRKNPVARKFGFHKKTLAALADRVGIEYLHFPALGIESAARKQLNSRADYDRLFAEYSRTTLKSQSETVHNVAALVEEKSTALMCMEADPAFCHRAHLAARIAKLTQLRIGHI